MTGEPNDDEPLDVNIPEFEGMRRVEGLGISIYQFSIPLKIKKFNIDIHQLSDTIDR